MRFSQQHARDAQKPADLGLTDRLRAAEVLAVYDSVVIGVAAAVGAAVALVVALTRLGALAPRVGVAWAGYIGVCAAAHMGLRLLYARQRPGEADWRAWAAWFTALSLAEGLGWGWGSVGLAGAARLDLQLMAFVVCFGIAAGSVPAFAAYLPAFLCLFVPATVPQLVWSVWTVGHTPQQVFFLLLTAVFILGMGGLGWRSHLSFDAIVSLRIRTEDLAADLRLQKEVAEAANRAKSAFLAAASHDLRQPVHALSLFVGALRNVALPPEGERLVGQIEASTQALDGLFGALLDLSRLDAGVVDAQPCAFAIDPLLARICADHAGEADAKALRLARAPCSLAVRSDPVLLERVLRNLVVNAIRHTCEGRVLVGCRRRAGRLWVEVWDTGPGIPEMERERVFDEYVQLDNPERDRVKGLGLGLAIVRRLCALLDHPIELASRPSRGSCFRVALPIARGVPAAPAPVAAPDEADGGERGGLVLVIDDEQAIRDGMAALLRAWGYAVAAAASGPEMVERLAACATVPSLIVCDYRLRAGENGLAVIDLLRSEFNEAIPAVLITGDTGPERLAEARASGIPLLHKPVPNDHLRAAVRRLVAAPGAADPASDADLEAAEQA